MERKHREKPTHDVDLKRPLSKETKKDIATQESTADSCFGTEWDAAANECGICADNELCCIFHRSVVDKRAKEIEKKSGALYLDRTDFEKVDKDKLLFQMDLKSGVMTASELLDTIMLQAETSDRVAAVEWLKRWKVETGNKFTTKEGIVYYKK